MENSHQSAGNGIASGQAVESGPLAAVLQARGFDAPALRISYTLWVVADVSHMLDALTRLADDGEPAVHAALIDRGVCLSRAAQSLLGDSSDPTTQIVERTYPGETRVPAENADSYSYRQDRVVLALQAVGEMEELLMALRRLVGCDGTETSVLSLFVERVGKLVNAVLAALGDHATDITDLVDEIEGRFFEQPAARSASLKVVR